MPRPICPACGSEARLMFGSDACPDRPELADEPVWACTICAETYAECRPGTEEPIGSLADGGLRYARAQVIGQFHRLVREAVWPELTRDRLPGFIAAMTGRDRAEFVEPHALDLERCQRAYAALSRATIADVEHWARAWRGPVKAKREALV